MKRITLTFAIPDDVDTPSETLLKMRDLLLEGLRLLHERHGLTGDEKILAEALLTES